MSSFRVLQSALALSVALLVTGCTTIKFPATPVTPTVVSGNWFFYNVTTNATTPSQSLPFSFGGSLLVTDKTQVSGIFHVDQPCLGSGATDIPYTGILSGDRLDLTSSAVNGEILAIHGTLDASGTKFHAESLTLTGPCSGTVTALTGPNGPGSNYDPLGNQQPALQGSWSTNPANPNPQITLQLTQAAAPDAHGQFALAGTASVTGSPCFTTGTLQSPSFVSGGEGQLTIRFNDGSTLSSKLLAFALQGVAKSVVSIDSATITGGNCNVQGAFFSLQ